MKKLAVVAINMWLSYFLWVPEPTHAADFFCPSGNVTCLIAAINDGESKFPAKYHQPSSRDLHARQWLTMRLRDVRDQMVFHLSQEELPFAVRSSSRATIERDSSFELFSQALHSASLELHRQALLLSTRSQD